MFANEVIIDVDMFSIRVSNRIMSKSYIVLIISIGNSNCSLSKVKVKVLQ